MRVHWGRNIGRWQIMLWPTVWRFIKNSQWPTNWEQKGFPGPIYDLWFVFGPVEIRRFWRGIE